MIETLVRVALASTDSKVLLAIVAGIYLFIAFGYWKKGSAGMALAFVSYAVANVGFIIAE